MKRRMTFGLASVFSLALVHCAADQTDGNTPDTSPQSEADGASPNTDADAGEETPDAADAAAPDAADDATAPGDASVCSPDEWCQTSLPAADVELQAVWSFGVDDAIAAGPAGAIQWNGTAWSAVASPDVSLEGLTGLCATAPTDIWGTDENANRLVHGSRTAPGAPFQWSEITSYSFPFPVSFLRSTGPKDLWGLSRWPSSSIYLVHAVLPDADQPGEPVWTTTSLPVDAFWNFTLSGFAITEDKEIWIGGYVSDFGWPPPPEIAHVYHGTPPATEDGEYTWEESFTSDGSLPTLVATLWAPHSDDVWVISNLGTTYDPIPKPTVNYHRGVEGSGPAVWSSIPNNSSAYATAVWGSAKNDVWTVGTSGAIRRWNGTKWSTSRISADGTPLYKDLFAIHGSSANDIWAVGNGIALHRAPGGAP